MKDTYENITVPANKNIVLNLNNNSVINVTDSSCFNVSGMITIKNGLIAGHYASKTASLYINENSEVHLSNVVLDRKTVDDYQESTIISNRNINY